MTFKERVIEKIKEHFPNAEFKFSGNKAYEIAANLEMGIAPPKNESDGDGLEYLHRAIRCDPPFGSGEDGLIETLNELRFFKEPIAVLIRCIESGDKFDSELGCVINIATARFSLGYKS